MCKLFDCRRSPTENRKINMQLVLSRTSGGLPETADRMVRACCVLSVLHFTKHRNADTRQKKFALPEI